MQIKIKLKEFLILDITLALAIVITILYYGNMLEKNEIKGNTGCDIEYIYSDQGKKIIVYDLDSIRKLVWFLD